MNDYLYHVISETAVPPYGVLLADHFCRPYGYYGHRSRGTKDWLLIYTVSGKGEFRINKEVRRCTAGDVAILSPGTPHHYATAEHCEWELLWAHFMPLPEWLRWLQLPRTSEGLIVLTMEQGEPRQRMADAFRRLIADHLSGEAAEQELAQIALAEIIALVQRQHVRSRGGHADARVGRTIALLTERLADKLTLGEIADAVGVSVSRLSHLFKAETGRTVMETLTAMRLQRAAKLLYFTARPVADIAAEVGFESAFYFTRRFTAEFGASPSAYRKLAVGQPGRAGDGE